MQEFYFIELLNSTKIGCSRVSSNFNSFPVAVDRWFDWYTVMKKKKKKTRQTKRNENERKRKLLHSLDVVYSFIIEASRWRRILKGSHGVYYTASLVHYAHNYPRKTDSNQSDQRLIWAESVQLNKNPAHPNIKHTNFILTLH